MCEEETNGKADETKTDADYPAPLQLDMEKYRSRVDRFDITDEERAELLLTLWDIMRRMAELSYGVDNVHRFVPALKEISGELEKDELEQTQHSAVFNSSASDQSQGKDSTE